MELTGIVIYPVKSLGGIHLTESLVEREGLQYDRRWMLLDENDNFITQRTVPKMALFIPEINDGDLIFSYAKNGFGEIKTPLDIYDGPARPVKVWNDEVAARSDNKKTDEWFSDILGFKCKLVKMEKNAMRQSLKGGPGEYVSFADMKPFLIIGEASLADLNSRLETPVPMNRFRPNFVFAGGEAYVEDTWDEYKIGNIKIENTKPCDRCLLTTVDQAKGEKTSAEPLRTLSTYRKKENKVNFGMRAKLGDGQMEAVVKIGDEIMVENIGREVWGDAPY